MNWIKIEDDLPKRGESVLVSDGKKTLEAHLTLFNNWERLDYKLSFMKFEVKAWMPMPKWDGGE